MRCHYDLVHAQRVPLRYHAQHPSLGDYLYELGVSYNTRTSLARVHCRVTYGLGCENGWVEKIDVDGLRNHPQLRPEDEHAHNLRDAGRRRQERRQFLEAHGNWASGTGTSASPSMREPSGTRGRHSLLVEQHCRAPRPPALVPSDSSLVPTVGGAATADGRVCAERGATRAGPRWRREIAGRK